MNATSIVYESSTGWSAAFPPVNGKPTLVLVFGASAYLDAQAPIIELLAAYPDATVAGCSTAGEIGGTRIKDGSLGRVLATPDLRAVFVLSDGLSVNGSDLVRSIQEAVGSAVVVTGGLAADGSRFQRAWVVANSPPFFDELKSIVADQAPQLAPTMEAAEQRADWSYISAEVPTALAHSVDGLLRVAKITASMKNFAHNDRGKHGPADNNSVLRTTLTVAGHELRSVANVAEDFGDIPEVICSRSALSQVFLNLIVNAAHAIGDVVRQTKELGKITVTTRVEERHLVVSIADTGGGIPPAVQRHLFEPFFTTKEVGRGTGQGLALARTIVMQQHAGTLDFVTQPGTGTTFVIRLLLAGAEASAKAA